MKLPFSHPLHLVIGLTIWLLWFSAAYGGLSLACRMAPPPDEQGAMTWINAAILVFSLLTVALLLLLGWRSWRTAGRAEPSAQQQFVLRVSAALYLASAIATLALGLPAVALPPCV